MKIYSELNSYKIFYKSCKKSGTNFYYAFFMELYYRFFFNKRIRIHQNVIINGIKNIKINGMLYVGTDYVGFVSKSDLTYLNINGSIQFQGDYRIGRGCRFDVGSYGYINFGRGGYVNSNTKFIIMNELIIGDNCAISWDCQFLDEDFHDLSYSDKKKKEKSIIIGNNVWIGCGVKIYKGTRIPDNCVIAANSIVRDVFIKPNSLIGGHPARILKENVVWH